MAMYGEMPAGWRLHNVSMGGEPAWIKTFEFEMTGAQLSRANKGVLLANKFAGANLPMPGKTMKRRVILGLNPFSGKWFWQTTGTATDSGKGDDMEYDDPVAAAVVCEMVFGSTKTYEPMERNEAWTPGTT